MRRERGRVEKRKTLEIRSQHKFPAPKWREERGKKVKSVAGYDDVVGEISKRQSQCRGKQAEKLLICRKKEEK